MSGPLNSPLDETSPVTNPEPPKPKRQKKNGWQVLASLKNLKEVNEHLEAKKEFYRRNLPTGAPVSGLSKAQRIQAWETAVVMVAEIEEIQAIIAAAASSNRKK